MSPWHVGRTVGVTLYKGDAPDDLVGVMVGPHVEACELAEEVVLAVNIMRDPAALRALLAFCEVLVDACDHAAEKHEPLAQILVGGGMHLGLAEALSRVKGAAV